MRRLVTIVALAAAFAGGFVVRGVVPVEPIAHAQAAGRVFELRTYTTNPGKLDALHARFRTHTLRIFEKHGMQNVGYFRPMDAPLADNTLVYIIAHKSREAAKELVGFQQGPRVAEGVGGVGGQRPSPGQGPGVGVPHRRRLLADEVAAADEARAQVAECHICAARPVV